MQGAELLNVHFFNTIKPKINLKPTCRLTHYSPVLLFYTPIKHQKNKMFYVFRGYRKATPGCNGLTKLPNGLTEVPIFLSLLSVNSSDNRMIKVTG